MTNPEQAAYRAQLNEELGFYPANLDEESVADYRRKDAEYRRRDGGRTHPHRWAHLKGQAEERRRQAALLAELAHLYE